MKGFTLPELIITMAITALIISATVMVGLRALSGEELNRARDTLRNQLVSARQAAKDGTYDATWGVAFATSSITRFQGTSFATRNPAFDMVETFGTGITITGAAQIIFTRPNGIPQATGTIVMTDGFKTATTTVNAYGTINIE